MTILLPEPIGVAFISPKAEEKIDSLLLEVGIGEAKALKGEGVGVEAPKGLIIKTVVKILTQV